MKSIYWNVGGLATPSSRLLLKKLCEMHKPEFLFISEPWIDLEQCPPRFWDKLKLKVFVVNNRNELSPNLWCACSDQWSPIVVANSDQHISFTVNYGDQAVDFSVVYASTNYLKRRSLWQELDVMQQTY